MNRPQLSVRSLTLLCPALALPVLALCGAALAQPAGGPVSIPREKVSLVCTDDYFNTARTNFILQDEQYTSCTLNVPLALHERWPGKRTFYVIPRVSANLYAKDDRGNGRWLPLSPLVPPGADALHTTLDSESYTAVALVGKFGKLSDVAGKGTPDTVGAGGKLTVCVSPIRSGEDPCVTFDLTARFRVYRR